MSRIYVGKIYAKTSTKPKRRYRVDYAIFDKGLPIPPEDFKQSVRKDRRISKADFDARFEVVYVRSVINKRKKTHNLVICKKSEANGLFIMPKVDRILKFQIREAIEVLGGPMT